jgi:hypothetical protein
MHRHQACFGQSFSSVSVVRLATVSEPTFEQKRNKNLLTACGEVLSLASMR